MLELGFCLQMTKWGNLIKYRICKSICAADYKGSASLNPQSDISPNGSYINQWTNQIFLRRPPLHFLTARKRRVKLFLVLLRLYPLCQKDTLTHSRFNHETVWKENYTTGHWICYFHRRWKTLRGAIKKKGTLRRADAPVMNRCSLFFDVLKNNFLG